MRSRGQALVETAVFLPLFLLAFFGMIWVLRTGVLLDRAALGVRYAGTVDANQDLVTRESLFALTASLRNPTVTTADACSTPIPNAFGQDGNYGSRAPQFWQPSSGATPIASCTSGLPQSFSGIAGVVPGQFLLNANVASLSVSQGVSGYLQQQTGMAAAQGISARTTFFSAPSLAVSLHCYPDMVDRIGRSLKLHGADGHAYYDDQYPLQSEAFPTPLPKNWSVNPLAFTAACNHVDSTSLSVGITTSLPNSTMPEALWTPIALPGNSVWNSGVVPTWPVAVAPQSTAPANPPQPTGPPGTLPGPPDGPGGAGFYPPQAAF